LGYLAGLPEVTRFGLSSAPLHPLGGVLFMLFGAYLALSVTASPAPRRLYAFGVVIGIICGAAVIAQLLGLSLPFSDQVGPALQPSGPPDQGPSHLALTLAFGCAALAAILKNGASRMARGWMVIPLLPVFWVTYLSLAANFYEIEHINRYFLHTLIPLPAALLFAFLLAGFLATQPRDGFMAALNRRYLGGALAGVAFPVILITPFTVGWIRIRALRSGEYDLAAAFSQFATTNIIIFGAFIWFCAHMLNRIDARRQKTMDSLQATNLEFQRVNSELQRVNSALQSKIEEQIRTEKARKQTELELFQSQKMEAMGTLATGIAHDFNNILTVIQLNAENAQDTAMVVAPDSKDLLQSLQDIRKSGTRAANVVRQIMTFGRKTPGEMAPLNVGDALEEAVEMLRHTIPKSVNLIVEVAPDVPPILADPTMVQQVLLNLGTNANHALAESGGELRITVDNYTITADLTSQWRDDLGGSLPEGHYVRVRVMDTGQGMDDETEENLRPVFYHQATWQRHWFGTFRSLGNYAPSWGRHYGEQSAWPRHDLQCLFSSGS
jgi:signal transduction histidine kinase